MPGGQWQHELVFQGPQRCMTSLPLSPDSGSTQHSPGFSWLHAHLPQASQGHPRNLLIKHCQMPSSGRKGTVEAPGPSAAGWGSRLSLYTLSRTLAAHMCVCLSPWKKQKGLHGTDKHGLHLALQVNPPIILNGWTILDSSALRLQSICRLSLAC